MIEKYLGISKEEYNKRQKGVESYYLGQIEKLKILAQRHNIKWSKKKK